MIGIEIVTDKQAKTQGGAERDRIVELAFERGLLLLGCVPIAFVSRRRSSSLKSSPTSQWTCWKNASTSPLASRVVSPRR